MQDQLTRRETLKTFVTSAMAISALHQSAGLQADQSHRKIRVAQIGVGHPHASKLETYRQSADYEVVGLAEPNPALRERLGQHRAYQGVKTLSVEEILNDESIEVVLVETEIAELLDFAGKCVQAGKHVHIDKPAGSSLPQLEEIQVQARQKNLMVQMGYMYRYNPAVLLLQEFLHNGWLGNVYEITAVMSRVIAPPVRLELAEYNGGAMFELGCHLIDLVVGLMGEPEQVTPYLKHSSSILDGMHDNCLAVLEWPGATATIRSSANEVEGFGRRHLTVIGTEGSFHIQPLDDPKAIISLDRPRGKYRAGTQNITFPDFPRYVADAAEMAAVIRGEREFRFPIEHDLNVQRTVLRASKMPLDR